MPAVPTAITPLRVTPRTDATSVFITYTTNRAVASTEVEYGITAAYGSKADGTLAGNVPTDPNFAFVLLQG